MKAPRQRPSKARNDSNGSLYVVSTPIGNLNDITLRALQILRDTKTIACEDTRRFKKLLSHFEIKGKRLVSYYRGVERRKNDSILKELASGRDVVLASDAGTPCISDPGWELVQLALAQGSSVRSVPGASAPIAALSISGLASDSFLFLGYLPRKTKERREFLSPLRWERRTLVFFEVPHRLAASLADLAGVFGRRRMALARELTKMNEEVIRGTAEEVCKLAAEEKARGEVTIILEGLSEGSAEIKASWSGFSLAAHLERLVKEEGLPLSRAVEKLEQIRQVPANVLYQIAREEGLEKKK